MNLYNYLNNSAERHPWRWALGMGFAFGLLYGLMFRSLLGGVLFGLCGCAIQLVGAGVRRLFRRRAGGSGFGAVQPPG